MKNFIQYIFASFLIMTIGSCKKSTFLNALPDNSLAVPKSLKDFQAILNNDITMNNSVTPSLGNLGDDNLYLTQSLMDSRLNSSQVAIYRWDNNPYAGLDMADWDAPYRSVYYANTVLEGLAGYTPNSSEKESYQAIKASALFFRAHAFWQLAQIFCPPLDSSNLSSEYGLPLRLKPDINEKISRATISQTYIQIIEDLSSSVGLLPLQEDYQSKPNRSAGYGLLARVMLGIGNYNMAKKYADSSLQFSSGDLLDFSTFSTTDNFPFKRFNSEVLFDCTATANAPLGNIFLPLVDTILYNSYDSNDRRKSLYFKKSRYANGITFLGTYSAGSYPFTGIALDEIYLIRAEAEARLDRVSEAMNDLNTLLKMRWAKGTFIPLAATTADDALVIILSERRKELMYRGLRWPDLRRLNKEQRFSVTIRRVVNNTSVTLMPNDKRYTWVIPDNVLAFNPSMKQNPR